MAIVTWILVHLFYGISLHNFFSSSSSCSFSIFVSKIHSVMNRFSICAFCRICCAVFLNEWPFKYFGRQKNIFGTSPKCARSLWIHWNSTNGILNTLWNLNAKYSQKHKQQAKKRWILKIFIKMISKYLNRKNVKL